MNKLFSWLENKGIVLIVKSVLSLILIIFLVLFAFGMWDNLIDNINMLIKAKMKIGILAFVGIASYFIARGLFDEIAIYSEYNSNTTWQSIDNDLDNVSFKIDDDDLIRDFVKEFNSKEQLAANQEATEIAIEKLRLKIHDKKSKDKPFEKLQKKLDHLKSHPIHKKIKYIIPYDIISKQDTTKSKQNYGKARINKRLKIAWWQKFKLIDIFKIIVPVTSGVVVISWFDWWDGLKYLIVLLIFILASGMVQIFFKRKYIKYEYVPTRKSKLDLCNDANKYIKNTPIAPIIFNKMVEAKDFD